MFRFQAAGEILHADFSGLLAQTRPDYMRPQLAISPCNFLTFHPIGDTW